MPIKHQITNCIKEYNSQIDKILLIHRVSETRRNLNLEITPNEVPNISPIPLWCDHQKMYT